MPFREGEYIFLADAGGKRYWTKVSYGMLSVPSVGTIDGSKFRDMDDGHSMTVAGTVLTAFRPGTVDMIASIERGAQIITPKDAAYMIMNCDIKCGDTVIEAGAGSGALTTALLRAVAPNGTVHTIEIREDHAARARKNLERNGLDGHWRCHIGDARDIAVDVVADALITDIPDPWAAFGNLSKNLRPGGRICSYVPNMNQAESAVNALREMNCFGVHAVELLERGLEVHPGGVRPSFEMLGHTGYLVIGRKRA